MKRALFGFLFVVACLVPRAWAENWKRGPIELENQYFFDQFHLSSSALSPEIIEAYEFRFSAAWSSTSILEDSYVVDLETVTVPLQFNLAVSSETQVGVKAPIVSRAGGALDNLIESWHRIFSLPKGDRDSLDDDSYQIAGTNDDGSSFNFEDEGVSLGIVSFGVKHQVSAGSEHAPAWAFRAELGLPSAKDEYGNEGVDLLIGGLGSKRWGKMLGYWGLSGIYFTDTETANVEFRPFHLEGFATVEYELLESTSALLGIYSGSGSARNIETHPDYFMYLDAGMKVDVSAATVLELCLRENPVPGDGTVDVSFYLGVSSRFS